MNNFFSNRSKIRGLGKFFLFGLAIFSIQLFAFETNFGQTKKRKPASKKKAVAKKIEIIYLPKVTQIDLIALQNLLKREGENAKPLLINFWATWCDPCKEEFPDLVKIDSDYKGKIDFLTVSLDDLAEINRDVPKFLAQMKAFMPAYLLKTPDEGAAMELVAKDWQGALPFTVLFNPKGEAVFTKQGKIKPDVLRGEIDKFAVPSNVTEIILPKTVNSTINKRGDLIRLPTNHRQQIVNLPVVQYSFEKGKVEAQKDISNGKLIIRRYGLTIAIPPKELKRLKEKYGVEIVEQGCIVPGGFIEYVNGYNETTMAEIKRKFGNQALEILAIK
jgi:thiol-disulfide isomerase/thioredoxin